MRTETSRRGRRAPTESDSGRRSATAVVFLLAWRYIDTIYRQTNAGAKGRQWLVLTCATHHALGFAAGHLLRPLVGVRLCTEQDRRDGHAALVVSGWQISGRGCA